MVYLFVCLLWFPSYKWLMSVEAALILQVFSSVRQLSLQSSGGVAAPEGLRDSGASPTQAPTPLERHLGDTATGRL